MAAVLGQKGKGQGRQLEAYMHHDAVEWRPPISVDSPPRASRAAEHAAGEHAAQVWTLAEYGPMPSGWRVR